MQHRTLGNSGLRFSTIGLGTWAIGGGNWKFGWGPQDRTEAIQGILCAVELGVNWIDTAAVYGNGVSEEIVGAALREIAPNDRPIVATKCSRVVQPDGEVLGDLSRANIFREVDMSLKRLGVDVIDLYQLHWPKPPEDIEEAWGAMSELAQQGKVKHIGVSNFNVPQMQRILPIHPITSLQPPYSMLVRDAEDELLPFCKQNGIGVIVYSPMYKGLLTGAFDAQRAANLDSSDHRSRDPQFQQPLLGCHLELVESLRPIANRNDRSLAELSIAWTLRNSAVTAAIVGARSPSQIEATAGAGNWRLTEADQEAIATALEKHAAAVARS